MEHTNVCVRRFYVQMVLVLGALFFSQGSFAYCTSQGNNTNYEWIDSVTIGTTFNFSGADGGYLDNTQQIISVAPGAVSIALTPGFNNASYTEYWRVWIDFNQDDAFQTTEQVYSGSSSGSLNGSISIPNDVLGGETRLRVSMQYGSSPSSCGSFTYGEVEDYTVFLDVVDTSSPTVVATSPTDAATQVALNSNVEVTFSENIDPQTVNANSMLMTLNGVIVQGVVTNNNSVVTFTPAQPLLESSNYSVIVSGVADLAGNPLIQDASWAFTTADPDIIAPTVTQTSPQDGDADVANNFVVQVQFSEPMDEQTINTSSFTISDGVSNRAGTINVLGSTAQFYTDQPFDYSTNYTATLNSSVSDVNGNPLGQDYSWNFTSRDFQQNYCTSSSSNYSLFWIESVRVGSVTASYQGTPISGYRDSTSTSFNVSRFFNSLELTPAYSGSQYPTYWRVLIDHNQDGVFANDEIAYEGSGIGALNGSFSIPDSAMGGHTRMRIGMKYGSAPLACETFTYGQVVDYRVLIPEIVQETVPPTVDSISPIDGAIDVSITSVVTAQLSEELNAATVNPQSVVLETGGLTIASSVNFDSLTDTITLVPSSPLDSDTSYSVVLSTEIEDLVGNALVNPYQWTFTTAQAQANSYLLSGGASANGAPLEGVSMTATGNTTFNATTNASGNYTFTGMPTGSYAITASKVGYSFTPQSVVVDVVDTNIAAVDFVGQAATSPLANGDFETGDFSGFTSYETSAGDMASAVINIDANNNGSLSRVGQFVVGVDGSANVGNSNGGGVYQNVVLQDGDLNVTMDVTSTSSGNNGDGGIAEVLFDGVVMDSHDFGGLTAGVKEYETLSFNVPNVSAGVHEIRIQFTRKYLKGTVSQLLDNIVLTGASIGN